VSERYDHTERIAHVPQLSNLCTIPSGAIGTPQKSVLQQSRFFAMFDATTDFLGVPVAQAGLSTIVCIKNLVLIWLLECYSNFMLSYRTSGYVVEALEQKLAQFRR
jgi:hypothetical protein